jgi:hypothetical protein
MNHSAAPGKFQANVNNSSINGTTTAVTNQWYAIAVTREAGVGGLTRLFVDGVIEATGSGLGLGNALNLTTNGVYIGAKPAYTGATVALNGWMDEFRVTKGVARYTANYTPAAAQFPDL